MSSPVYCRPAAWQLMADHAPAIARSTAALLRAAVAVSMHELRTANPEDVERELDRIAGMVRERAGDGSPKARLAHLHEVMFEELGFRGGVEDYYSTKNSYVSEVLRVRRGLPITLSLVYKCIAEKVGLAVRGVNSPAHFLVRVASESDPLLVDPFGGGEVLSREDAYLRIETVSGRSLPRSEDFLPTATNRQWIRRIILNLKNIFVARRRLTDLRAMIELEELL